MVIIWIEFGGPRGLLCNGGTNIWISQSVKICDIFIICKVCVMKMEFVIVLISACFCRDPHNFCKTEVELEHSKAF